MKPYRWMMDFTPQSEWIDRQGLLLWLAFFFTEMGAGLYLVSLFSGFRAGCIIGWLSCAVLGGGLHVAYLGKPERAWRAILRPNKSELSRGIIILSLFLFIGFFQLLAILFKGIPWEGHAMFFKVIMSLLGFFVIIHGFLTLSVISAIPFWNSAIIPVLSLASGIWLGTQVVSLLGLGFGQSGMVAGMEPVARWSCLSYVFLTFFYLWNAKHGSLAAQQSLKLLVKGELAPLFYIGVVLLALIIPTAITLYSFSIDTDLFAGLILLRACSAFIGDLVLRYCVLKAARYFPLIESNIIGGIKQGAP
jgi:formate-dependent nitrite reductase membrane component NrfD